MNDIKEVSRNFVSKMPVVPRMNLKRSYINPDIASVEDFYAEEMLRYRSLVRQSREIKDSGVEVAQTLIFRADSDLVSQKKQSVSKDERIEGGKERFAHRGTVEEEVFNLGNYKNVLRKLRTVGLDDKSLAKTIRMVFCRGAIAFNELKVAGKSLSEFLSHEKKQIIIDTVELLFGTEGFRSPSAIIETNMMLDLIINDQENWNFERAFIGQYICSDDIAKYEALKPTLVLVKTGVIAGKNDVGIDKLFDSKGKLFSDWQTKFDSKKEVLVVTVFGQNMYFTGIVNTQSLYHLRTISRSAILEKDDIAKYEALKPTLVLVKTGVIAGKNDVGIDKLFDSKGKLFSDWQTKFDSKKAVLVVTVFGQNMYFTGIVNAQSLYHLRTISRSVMIKKYEGLRPNLANTIIMPKTREVEIGELFDPESGRLFTDWEDRFNRDDDVILVSVLGQKKFFNGVVNKDCLNDLRSISDIENGGDLSFTMKSTSGHSGGIACGRSLSQKVDAAIGDASLRSHKYGGSFTVRSEDYKEYERRKEAIAQSWVEKYDRESRGLEDAMRRSQDRWYRY